LSDLAGLGLVTTDDVSWYLSKPYYLYTDEKRYPRSLVDKSKLLRTGMKIPNRSFQPSTALGEVLSQAIRGQVTSYARLDEESKAPYRKLYAAACTSAEITLCEILSYRPGRENIQQQLPLLVTVAGEPAGLIKSVGNPTMIATKTFQEKNIYQGFFYLPRTVYDVGRLDVSGTAEAYSVDFDILDPILLRASTMLQPGDISTRQGEEPSIASCANYVQKLSEIAVPADSRILAIMREEF